MNLTMIDVSIVELKRRDKMFKRQQKGLIAVKIRMCYSWTPEHWMLKWYSKRNFGGHQ